MPFPLLQADLPKLMGFALNSLSSIQNKDPKLYSSWDAAVNRSINITCACLLAIYCNIVLCYCRILEAHTKIDKDFNQEAAATLAIRGVRQTKEGSYQFTRDLQAKTVRDD